MPVRLGSWGIVVTRIWKRLKFKSGTEPIYAFWAILQFELFHACFALLPHGKGT